MSSIGKGQKASSLTKGTTQPMKPFPKIRVDYMIPELPSKVASPLKLSTQVLLIVSFQILSGLPLVLTTPSTTII